MMPGDFITNKFMQMVIDGKMSEKEFNRLLEVYGLADRSFWGILKGYFTWIGNVFQGDLGRSFKYEDSVSTIIVENMGISFGIAFAALILEFIIAIPLGVKAATNQYGVVDYSASVLSMIGTALPTFFFASLLKLVFSVKLGWFDLFGLVSRNYNQLSSWGQVMDKANHLVLPIVTLVVISTGSLMRYTRTNMLEVLNADYIRTARAKGLTEFAVVTKHALRNALIPVITVLGPTVAGLLTGSFVVEKIFAIPGIGYYFVNSVTQRDYTTIMGVTIFFAAFLMAMVLLVDIFYCLIDPRIKFDA